MSQMSPSFAEIDAQLDPAYVHFGLREVRPGRFMKQLATMLLALSPGGFPAVHPELTSYARDQDMINLPDRYQFYLAFLVGPTARFNGGAGIWREKQGVLFTLELAFPPFAYILSVDEDSPALEAGNLTSFTKLEIDQVAEVKMDLRLGFSHTPFPLDFRTKAALERDRKANEAFEQSASDSDASLP